MSEFMKRHAQEKIDKVNQGKYKIFSPTGVFYVNSAREAYWYREQYGFIIKNRFTN